MLLVNGYRKTTAPGEREERHQRDLSYNNSSRDEQVDTRLATYLRNLPSIMCTAPRYSQLHFRSVIFLQSPSSQIDLPEKEKQTQKFREDSFSYWVSHTRT